MRRKQQREVVYVERGGDSSAKWLFWGALLGAGMALLYAPSSGEETRRNLQRRLWKLRAATEEKLDEISEQFGGARPGGWHRSVSGFIRRTFQAADEDNIPFLASALTFDALLAAIPFILLLLIGLTYLAEAVTRGPEVDTLYLFHRFLPPHSGLPDRDPFAVIERLLTGITENRGKLSIYAAPAFLWFSTRLFAGIRTSLNDIYDVSVRPPRPQSFILVYLLAKVRDSFMVVGTVVLFMANTLLTTGLAVLQARGSATIPQ